MNEQRRRKEVERCFTELSEQYEQIKCGNKEDNENIKLRVNIILNMLSALRLLQQESRIKRNYQIAFIGLGAAFLVALTSPLLIKLIQ
jgi:hypothetical protein